MNNTQNPKPIYDLEERTFQLAKGYCHLKFFCMFQIMKTTITHTSRNRT